MLERDRAEFEGIMKLLTVQEVQAHAATGPEWRRIHRDMGRLQCRAEEILFGSPSREGDGGSPPS